MGRARKEHFQKDTKVLTGVAQLVGHRPTKQKVAGSIPGTYLGCRFGYIQEATNQSFSLTLMFLSLSFSLPSPLSKNK